MTTACESWLLMGRCLWLMLLSSVCERHKVLTSFEWKEDYKRDKQVQSIPHFIRFRLHINSLASPRCKGWIGGGFFVLFNFTCIVRGFYSVSLCCVSQAQWWLWTWRVCRAWRQTAPHWRYSRWCWEATVRTSRGTAEMRTMTRTWPGWAWTTATHCSRGPTPSHGLHTRQDMCK